MRNKYLLKTIIIVIWLVIWQVLAVLVNNNVLLAGPIDTFKALVGLCVTGSFYISILKTLIRVILGFIFGCTLGLLLSMCSYKWELVREFLSPFVSTIKSIPVVSFIILALIWFGSSNVSLFVSGVITFPIVYKNTLEGLMGTDIKLIEVAKVFEMKAINKIRYIYLPAISTHLKAALSLAIGMAWRGGITAEVIGQPLSSVGNGIYRAKVNLATSEMLSWTIVVVLLAYLTEKIITFSVRRIIK